MKKSNKFVQLKESIEEVKLKKATKQSTVLRIVQFTSMGLILITILLFILTIVANSNSSNLNRNKESLVESIYNVSQGSSFLSSEARLYIVNGNKQQYDSYNGALVKLGDFTKTFEDLKKLGLTEGEQKTLDDYLSTANSLRKQEKEAFALVTKGDKNGATAIVNGTQYSTNVNKLYELCDQLNASITDRMGKSIAKAEKSLNVYDITSIICVILAAFIQFICLLFVMKKLMNPVKKIYHEMIEISQGNLSSHFDMKRDTSEIGTLAHSIHETKDFLKRMIDDISNALGNMAKGNYDIEITTEYIGEFAQIKESLNIIIDSSNSVLSQISQASAQVASGSNQVASGAQALSQGATEQASSIQELSAVISEISDKIRMNAQNAIEANRVTEVAADSLQQGNDQMTQMVAAMASISEASHEISKIIKTIDDIAFQTNILALNAAVEAARAGAAGKGFAVVAEEVRNLASKSAVAAKTTTELIEGAIEAVENGKQIADLTASTLTVVVDNAKKSTDLIGEITISSNEQASAISQVTQGVDQISGVVQTNSATAEQSAAASEELSGQSQLLNDLIGKFTLRDENHKNLQADNIVNDVVVNTYYEPQETHFEGSLGGKY